MACAPWRVLALAWRVLALAWRVLALAWQALWRVLCSTRHGTRQRFVGMACAGACMAGACACMAGAMAGALQQTPWHTPLACGHGVCLLLPWRVPKRVPKRVYTPAHKRVPKRVPKRLRECRETRTAPPMVARSVFPLQNPNRPSILHCLALLFAS